MKKSNIFRTLAFSLLVLTTLSVFVSSCKKDEDEDERNPPAVSFKTDAGYTFADDTVGQGDTIKVGIVATKTEDELNTFNVSYNYDGASTSTTYYNYSLSAAEYDGYSKDTTFVTRSVAGTEKWSFTITDRDGNITTKSFTLTVQ